MATGISFNPVLQVNAPGTFNVTSEGYVQGTFLDDPAIRNSLVASNLVGTATYPIWGGCAITEYTVNGTTLAASLQTYVQLATSQANVTGFTVFNQAGGMIQTPQSPVPLTPQTGGISIFRLGSGARIVVQADPAVATALQNSAVNTAVYWDYTNQKLLNAPGGTALAVKVVDVNVGGSEIVVFSTSTGFATWNYTGSTVVIQI